MSVSLSGRQGHNAGPDDTGGDLCYGLHCNFTYYKLPAVYKTALCAGGG